MKKYLPTRVNIASFLFLSITYLPIFQDLSYDFSLSRMEDTDEV